MNGPLIAIWIITGFLAFGLTFAYFQRQYPELCNPNSDRYIHYDHVGIRLPDEWKKHQRIDLFIAFFTCAFGPLGLLAMSSVLLFSKRYHGFKWDIAPDMID